MLNHPVQLTKDEYIKSLENSYEWYRKQFKNLLYNFRTFIDCPADDRLDNHLRDKHNFEFKDYNK